MELEKIQKLLSERTAADRAFINDLTVARRYYVGLNDILFPNLVPKPWLPAKRIDGESVGNPIRSANNRVACNYYNFLVDQKASYIMGDPPWFDSGKKSLNERIANELGAHWKKTCKHLVVDASNASVAWLHSWRDEDGFHYGVVDPAQIKAVWGGTLNQELLCVMRCYHYCDPETFEEFDIVEYWDKEMCHSYKKESGAPYSELVENPWFSRYNPVVGEYEETNEYVHGFSKVPFTAFFNNQCHLNDLRPIKGYIDAYDKVFSLFTDNLEDVQQVIFILENLGGTNLEQFRDQLRREKAVKVINDDYIKTDVRTLTIEIPTEASTVMLELARKNMFEQGRGVDPSPTNYAGNTSGEALKYMYANLDLKCVALKDEFEIGFEHFISLLIESIGQPGDAARVVWGNPTKINNETEQIANVVASAEILSERTLMAHHPWSAGDPDGEIERLNEERENAAENAVTENDGEQAE